MSIVRLLSTAAVMAGVGCALSALAPDPVATLRTLGRVHEAVPPGSAPALVLALTGLLAWVVWAWGAVGLLVTAASGLPGLPGAAARLVAALLVPERLRSAAALALGVGIALTSPASAAPSPPGPPDWPAGTTDPPPATAEPADEPPEQHVVVPGDCLWSIAADRLAGPGRHPTDARTARAVTAWFAVNADVIGADPDLIHPGQVLQAPPPDPDPAGGPR